MSVLDALKPHRAEALQRIRTNSFCLIILVILSYLLPLPTLPTAFNHALFSVGFERTMPVPLLRWSLDAAFTWVCTIGKSIKCDEKCGRVIIKKRRSRHCHDIPIQHHPRSLRAQIPSLPIPYKLTRQIKNAPIKDCTHDFTKPSPFPTRLRLLPQKLNKNYDTSKTLYILPFSISIHINSTWIPILFVHCTGSVSKYACRLSF